MSASSLWLCHWSLPRSDVTAVSCQGAALPCPRTLPPEFFGQCLETLEQMLLLGRRTLLLAELQQTFRQPGPRVSPPEAGHDTAHLLLAFLLDNTCRNGHRHHLSYGHTARTSCNRLRPVTPLTHRHQLLAFFSWARKPVGRSDLLALSSICSFFSGMLPSRLMSEKRFCCPLWPATSGGCSGPLALLAALAL